MASLAEMIQNAYDQGWTRQVDLATACEVKPAAVYAWEKGGPPEPERIPALAKEIRQPEGVVAIARWRILLQRVLDDLTRLQQEGQNLVGRYGLPEAWLERP